MEGRNNVRSLIWYCVSGLEEYSARPPDAVLLPMLKSLQCEIMRRIDNRKIDFEFQSLMKMYDVVENIWKIDKTEQKN